MKKEDYLVRTINREEARAFFLDGHYLKKWPRTSFLFGLFKIGELVGAVSYGTPSSPASRMSVAGRANSLLVLELNRLFLKDNLKNEASFLISNSIKLLPKPKIIITYADESQGHHGTIYKASNFVAGGKSEGYHYDWAVKGKDELHQSTLFREFKNDKNKIEKIKEKYGAALYKKKRSPKSRFYLIHAEKADKKRLQKEIVWE